MNATPDECIGSESAIRRASASSRARMMIRPNAARVSPGAVAGPAPYMMPSFSRRI
jgi:hypothetical protein